MESDHWSDFTKNCPNLVKEVMKTLAQEKYKIKIRLEKATYFEFTHLSVNPSDRVEKIKAMLQENLETEPENLRLIFEKTKLKDHKSLADYKVNNKSTIQYTTCVNTYDSICPNAKEDVQDDNLPVGSVAKFAKDLGKLMEEGTVSDVTLTCQGGKFSLSQGHPCSKKSSLCCCGTKH